MNEKDFFIIIKTSICNENCIIRPYQIDWKEAEDGSNKNLSASTSNSIKYFPINFCFKWQTIYLGKGQMIKLTSTSTEQVSKIISAKKLCRHILWQNFIIKRRVLYERVVISILFSTAWPDVKMKSSPDVDQKLTQQFVILILQLFKIADEVTKYLGNFCKRICCKGLSKVAQSGHTGVLINDLLCSNLHYSQWDGLTL